MTDSFTDNLYTDEKLLYNTKQLLLFCVSKDMQLLYNTNKILYSKIVREKYKDFLIKYPGLFSMIIENPIHFDMKRLIYMINCKKKIVNKQSTFEEMSSKIGKEYYEEFVKEKIENITPSS